MLLSPTQKPRTGGHKSSEDACPLASVPIHWAPGRGDLRSKLSPIRRLKGLPPLSAFLGGHAIYRPAPAQVAGQS